MSGVHEPAPGVFEQAAAAVSVPDRIDTPLGSFEMFDGVPTAETVDRLYDAVDLIRGVDVFLNCVPGASLVAMRNGFRSVGLSRSNQVGYTDPRANSGSLFLTPNTETTYGSMFFDLRETGPFVIEPPVESLCVVDDFWFRYVADTASPAPTAGRAGSTCSSRPTSTATPPTATSRTARRPTPTGSCCGPSAASTR